MRRPPYLQPSPTKMADAALGPGPLQSELEVLQAIFLDDMTVSHEDGRPHPWEVTVHLTPATGEDLALSFVRLTLHLQLQHSYPCSTPLITISNPRGFSEQQINRLVETLRILAQEQLGSAVLFQLVQVAKEALTTTNSHPHGACTICLHSLQESEEFVRSPCFHYFHAHCLSRYALHRLGEGRLTAAGGAGPGLVRHQRHGVVVDQRHSVVTDQGHSVVTDQRHGGVVDQRHGGAGGEGKERWGGLEAESDEVVMAPCPVCRAEMELKIAELQNAEEPHGAAEEPWVPDERERQRREETERGLRRQRERGGTVDTQTQRGAFIISLATPTRVEDSPPITLELSAPPQPISTEDTDSSPSSQQQRYRPHHRPHHRRHHQQPMRGDDADRRGYLPANHSGHNWMRGGDGWRRPANQREPFGRAANQRRGLPPFSGAIGSEESLTNQETGCWEDPHEPTNRRAVSSTMLLANRGRARANRSHPFTERTANQSPASHLANEDVESSVANENIASSQSANDDVASSVANENIAASQSAKEDVASSKVANDSPAVSQSANQSAASSVANQIEGTYCGSSSQDNQNSPSLLSSPLTNEILEYSVANEIGASSSGNRRPLPASANHRQPGFSPANHRARLSANPKPAYTLANQNPGVAAGNRSKASSMANHSEEHYSTNHRQVCATANRRPVSSANQRPACSSTNQNSSSATANQKPAYSSANHRQDCSKANQSSVAPVANRSSAFLSANRNMDSATTMSRPSSSSANQKLAYSATNRRIVPSSTNQRPACALANPESLSTNCSEEHHSTNHKAASARANDRPACLSVNQRPPHYSLTNQRPAHSSLANQRAAHFSSANQRPAFEGANSSSRGRGRGGNGRGQAGPRACWDNSYDASGGRAASDCSIERRADV